MRGKTDLSVVVRKNKDQSSPRKPLVSVLFPVYNGAAYLKESILYILDQTYDNFEIIIIDDGSTDETASVIQKFSDPRIRFYKNQTNQGFAATVNRAIGFAKGEYLARQDVDDVSLPQRFEKQVAFMETHPDCGMVGTWASVEAVDKNAQYIRSLPVDSLVLKFELLFDNQFIHSSVMIRKKVFEKIGLYSTDKSVSVANDYDLWCRLVREFEVSNIPEILLIYREVPNSMSRINGQHGFFKSQVITIMSENLAWITGKVKPDKDTTDFAILTRRNYQMLSSRPRFRKISRLLYEAADRISSSHNSHPDILRSKVCAHLQSISNHYCNHLIYRYGAIFGRIMGLFYGVWKLNIGRVILRFMSYILWRYKNITKILKHYFEARTRYWTRYWVTRYKNDQSEIFQDYYAEDRLYLLNKIKSDAFKSVLEVGSKEGRNLRMIARSFPDVKMVGIDVNPEAVRIGNDLFRNEGFSNVTLFEGKAENLDFDNKCFDLVMVCAVLMYIDPKKIYKVLSEMLRVAAKRILILDWHDPELLKGKFKNHWIYNYDKLLQPFSNEIKSLEITKIPEDEFVDTNWKKYGYYIDVRLTGNK